MSCKRNYRYSTVLQYRSNCHKMRNNWSQFSAHHFSTFDIMSTYRYEAEYYMSKNKSKIALSVGTSTVPYVRASFIENKLKKCIDILPVPYQGTFDNYFDNSSMDLRELLLLKKKKKKRNPHTGMISLCHWYHTSIILSIM